MGLLRVQVGVLVGGGDEVADAVAHVTHDSLLSTTRQPLLERNPKEMAVLSAWGIRT
jgi:hypothetical protein